MTTQHTISPVDGRVYVERTTAAPAQIEAALESARLAQRLWRSVPVAERAAILGRFCDAFESRGDAIAEELSWQMGRPIRYAPNEVRGTLERARHMIAIAPAALADIDVGPRAGFRRFLRREPLGVVFTVAAWNYPYLIAVNSVVPALMAGNVVILKHSAQTPLCAERFEECLREAGLPEGAFQALHLSHADTERVIRDPRVDFVAFTGSASSSAAAIRPTSATTPTWPTRSRTSSTARTSTRVSPAAASSACTCTSASTTPSSRAGWTSPASTSSATRSSPRPRSGRWCARPRQRRSAGRSPPRSRPAAAP
jgi:acyl-CoA reductase-like NAD-dependent aldehyde dehydrogenase